MDVARAPTRPPAVAGLFYPADPTALEHQVQAALDAAPGPEPGSPAPKALIVPHAGYVYSGPTAARVYARLRGAAVERVVLLGPAHRVWLRGLAAPQAARFASPLGPVEVDRDAIERIRGLPGVCVDDAPHAAEHSLEVQLPFLQLALGPFRLVPLTVGDARDEEVSGVIDALWDGPGTLVVVSSDLSHYHDYETARRLDAATCRAIETLSPERLGPESACGRIPIRGLLRVARERGLRVRTLDLCNSGDTAGDRDRVVGYGGWVLA